MSEARAAATPKVSVVVPCYNGRRYLAECLRSIADVANPDWEAIVVDDGSTEPIRDVVEPFAPLVRYFRQANQGLPVARNTGVRETAGAYIRFLDCDDYLLPGRGLEEQVAVLDAHPGVGLVYGQSLKVDAQGRAFAVRSAPFGAGKNYIRSGGVELEDHLLLGNQITVSSTIVRRSFLEQAGGFQAGLTFAEDWECWLRLAQICSVGHVAEPMVAYRVHETSMTARTAMDQWLRAHTRILDEFFADTHRAQEFAGFAPPAYAWLYQRAARRASLSGQPWLAFVYASRALPWALRIRDWELLVGCLTHVAKSAMPLAIRRPFYRLNRRRRAAIMAKRSALAGSR